MLRRVFWIVLLFIFGCDIVPDQDVKEPGKVITEGYGGYGHDFKVPVPAGYSWEITQSWKEHCEYCDQEYPGWNFCKEMSHLDKYSEYGWDFNLPGKADLGKSVLATDNGVILACGYDKSWGNFAVIDHGQNICSRYAHMLDGSTDHLKKGDTVCQGLILGKIGNTGNSEGEHLHFQFENCKTKISIPMEFDDGNGLPICTQGADRFDNYGNYTFLKLTNKEKSSCGKPEVPDEPDEKEEPKEEQPKLDESGWKKMECGSFSGCPLVKDCDRQAFHIFADSGEMSFEMMQAASYLWGECAVEGKKDGGFHPDDKITRAEALKIPMYLFERLKSCKKNQALKFGDVQKDDWYYEVIACAVELGIANGIEDKFLPNNEVTVEEAAKFAVAAAVSDGVIKLKKPANGHFKYFDKDQWAFPYMETIYHYGGIDGDTDDYKPGQKITRGQFALMVSALSPCYCGNVVCEAGCACDQVNFACSDPSKIGEGSGGGDDDEEIDEEEEEINEEIEKDDEHNVVDEEAGPDLGVSCELNSEKSDCEDLVVKCEVENKGDEVFKLYNLVMHLVGTDAKVCKITDDNQKSGVSYQKIEPQEKKKVNSYYHLSCSEMPKSKKISMIFDVVEKISGGTQVYEDILETALDISSIYGKCAVKTCVPACSGKNCGSDGCGGDCGTCIGGMVCNSGKCENPEEEIDLSEEEKCTPKTCSGLKKSCGSYSDGCGKQLSCGSCSGGEVCQDGKCVSTCKPKSCSEMKMSCGSYSDGCGGQVNCGGCSGGQYCVNGSCQSVCETTTCSTIGKNCGWHSDGCGELMNCGNCPSGQICQDGFCKTSCKPMDCSDLGSECGVHNNGCGGTVNCGNCPGNMQCSAAGICNYTCAPVNCNYLNYQCGLHDDGCGGNLFCGDCPSMSECEAGKCVYYGDWDCFDDYKLIFNGQGAVIENLLIGMQDGNYFTYDIKYQSYTVKFDIYSEKEVYLIHGGSVPVGVLTDSSCPFAAWLNYKGQITGSPLGKPDVIGWSAKAVNPGESILLMVPPPEY